MKFMAGLGLLAAAFLTAATGCANEAAAPGDAPTPTQPPPEAASPSPSVVGDVELADVSESAAAVAKAVASGDVSTLIQMTITRPMACVKEVTELNEGPVCGDGIPVGTILDALPFAGCSGAWTADLAGVFDSLVRRAGAPAILARDDSFVGGWPFGRDVLVFRPLSPDNLIGARAVYMEAGSIVSVMGGCQTTESFVTSPRPMPTVLWRGKPVP